MGYEPSKKSRVHIDQRRTIDDAFIQEDFPEFKVRKITPICVNNQDNIYLGNHYHLSRAELFYIICGETEFKLGDIESKRRERYVLSPNQRIYVPAGVAHLVLPKPLTIILEISDELFNPKDQINYLIIW